MASMDSFMAASQKHYACLKFRRPERVECDCAASNRAPLLLQASTGAHAHTQKGRQIGGRKMVLHARGITHGSDCKPYLRWRRSVRRIGLRFVGFRLHWFCVSHPEIAAAMRCKLFWIANSCATVRVCNCRTKRNGVFARYSGPGIGAGRSRMRHRLDALPPRSA
jgi:hypothetical protein